MDLSDSTGPLAADPWPWLGYFTPVIAGAYAIFADRAAVALTPGTQQQQRSASTSCAARQLRSVSQTSGRQYQVSATRPSGSSWSS